MKHAALSLTIICLILSLMVAGCGEKNSLSPSDPVTLTLWHNYGGVMQAAMDKLVEEFHETEGKKLGIVINIESVNSSSVLQEKLLAAANGDPGAPSLPDITTCYPRIAITLANKGLLADMGNYFTEEELSEYVPSFLEEGIIDESLHIFPIAKSTEVLFVNQTLFDRFASQTGVDIKSLHTFEGLFETAKTYYEWTDQLTPDTQGDGKAFYMADSLFNLMQVGMEQLGADFITDESLNKSCPEYEYIHNLFLEAARAGYIAIYEGYSSDLQKTGDIVVSTGSTAGILYYGNTVTYPDNTTERVEYTIMPYPVFNGGEKVALQRGGGMVVISSDQRKEYAASIFLKWFTQKDHNMQFVSQTGYLPVTKDAFEDVMSGNYGLTEEENIKKLLNATAEMYKEYRFYIPPVFDGSIINVGVQKD